MIHALPGMGADRRMFPAPWNRLPAFVAHDWPQHQGESSLPEMAQRICREYTIQDGDVLVGASLGGMVAGEVAKIRRLGGLFLVGSAVHPEEVNQLLAWLHPLADTPLAEWLRSAAGKLPSELAQMFAGAEASFLRSMCRGIFQWEGLGSVSTRCFRLHGRHDLVILPPPRADLLLPGGHLISMTHAPECVAFIAAHLEAL